jgi:hypothetical protein
VLGAAGVGERVRAEEVGLSGFLEIYARQQALAPMEEDSYHE